MSSEIKLRFHTFRELKVEDKIKDRVEMIRLFCDVKFRTRDGWSTSYSAIVDTGAPISVIPFQIWTDSEAQLITDHKIRGVVPKEECTLPVLVGRVNCILVDRENFSKERRLLVYLALTNEIPLILGFKDLLSAFELSFSYPDHAWVRER